MRFLVWLAIGLGLSAVHAAAPDSSVRPIARGGVDVMPGAVRLVRVSKSSLAPARSVRPVWRVGPSRQAVEQTAVVAPVQVAQTRARLLPGFVSVRPKERPPRIVRKAGSSRKEARVTAKGAICGVNEIKGQSIAPIRGSIRGCGVQAPVAVTSISGVVLSTPAKIDCGTAKALNSWVKDSLKPTVGRLGGGVASLKVAAHYACRTRNNRKGAKISEHGKGRAVDISAINLKNGQSITVLKGWRRKVEGQILKKVHKGACGPFGTVLGPNADRYHQDHFHFDTARYRSGSYCR